MQVTSFRSGLLCSLAGVAAVAVGCADIPDGPRLARAQAGSVIEISEEGGARVIRSNGLPDHPTGQFPNRGNPNRISPQSYTFRVPLKPSMTGSPSPLAPLFGVAINGVPFEPGTAEIWDPSTGRRGFRGGGRFNWSYDALGGLDLGIDQQNAHVQPSGAYHYHGVPEALATLKHRDGHPRRIGWAADGFPIYIRAGYADPINPASGSAPLNGSYVLKPGMRPGGGSGPGGAHDGTFVEDWRYVEGASPLDECNGRFAVTPDYPDGTYLYVLTDSFPFVPRCLMGEPDPRFARRPGPLGAGRPGAGRRGPDGPPRFGRPPPGRPPFGRPPR